jgi:hypothetical protein
MAPPPTLPGVDLPGSTCAPAAVVITTEDGSVLQCIPHLTDERLLAPSQWRWLLIEESGVAHVGPAINDDPLLGTLAERISAWWEARKELSYLRPGP